jgi:simple sugar transport system ATP-binding protein
MYRLELVDITKRYPGVVANDGVALKVLPGEVHAVLGENGAGKSTMMKIIYGSVQPDAGEVRWEGKRVTITSPEQARSLGIAMVFQHFSLFETLTVAENVWLGLARSTKLPEVIENIKKLAGSYGLEIDPLRPVHTLSVGERQRVEIVRALLTNPKLLILDEPTSVLTPQAVEKLFVTLRQLAANGCSILYISHKLDEIRAICTNCTVLRGGKVTGSVDPRLETNAGLAKLMIGSEPPQLEHRAAKQGEVALSVNKLSLAKSDPFGTALQDIELSVKCGEILGVAGVSGNGQKELLAALSGEDTRAAPGSLTLFGKDIARAMPRVRRAQGLHFVPEERLGRAAVPSLSLSKNTLLTRDEPVGRAGWLSMQTLKDLTGKLIGGYGVKTRGPEAPARSLSGGNLQKFIVGREIDATPKVLVVSQPTWGVDVGASAQIRGELLRLRDAGSAVLVVSEELDELFEISDALVVIAGGRLSPRIATRDATVARIGEWMSGLWHAPRPEVEEAKVA